MTDEHSAMWGDIVFECGENPKPMSLNNDAKAAIIAADQELKSSRDCIKELEEALRGIGVEEFEDGLCFCGRLFSTRDHVGYCIAARKALGIETSTP